MDIISRSRTIHETHQNIASHKNINNLPNQVTQPTSRLPYLFQIHHTVQHAGPGEGTENRGSRGDRRTGENVEESKKQKHVDVLHVVAVSSKGAFHRLVSPW